MKLLSLILLISSLASARIKDQYPSFTEMAKAHKEGVDFKVEAENRHSPVCVLAIHGGDIEPGTGEFARHIASDQLSYYIFRGLLPKDNRILHIGSDHFDDARAADISSSARVCVSIHGFDEGGDADIICLGGGNRRLRAIVSSNLKSLNLPVKIESPCTRLEGESARNVVNHAPEQGVQVELSSHLRKKLEKDSKLMATITNSVRDSSILYTKEQKP